MRLNIPLALTLVALLGVTQALAQGSRPTPMQEFMRQKLEHSKGVLEGLATEDFDLIGKNAKKLRAMSQESGWRAYDSPGYAWRMDLFRRNVDALAKAATDRNLDGATVSYINVTLNCVECHKFVRGKASASLEKGRGSARIAGLEPQK